MPAERNSQYPLTIRFGDTDLTLVKLKLSRSSHYVIFPFTKTGLHVSYHPNANPVLQEEKTGKNLASLDIASIKKLNARDARSLFGYLRHNSDVLAIPIESPSVFEKMAQRLGDIPYPFELLFQQRLVYKLGAASLREFLASVPGYYAIIDLRMDALLIYGEELQKLGPLHLGLHRPLGSERLSRLFSIQYALLDYLDSYEDAIKIPEPSYPKISEWKARLEALFTDVRFLRWNKGGRLRELGKLLSA